MQNAPRDDGRPREEEHPEAVPAVPIRLDDFVLVADPVLVPAPDRRAVMHAEHVDVLHLEPGRLDLVYDPTERARRVSTREDVFAHEETPARAVEHGHD